MADRKDAPLAFRIPAELKQELLQIADKEARSMSQICEIILRIGAEQYKRKELDFCSAISTAGRLRNKFSHYRGLRGPSKSRHWPFAVFNGIPDPKKSRLN
jgi:predicted DNA-binding protein